jgi:hypothetical protein
MNKNGQASLRPSADPCNKVVALVCPVWVAPNRTKQAIGSRRSAGPVTAAKAEGYRPSRGKKRFKHQASEVGAFPLSRVTLSLPNAD